MANWFYWQDKTLFLQVQLQPRASSNSIVGIHGDHLKIRITTPPLDGRANKHLITFLAGCFKVPQKQVRIMKGELSRIKLVRIESPKEMKAITEWMIEPK
ncbi:MAG: DUF167 family protein [Gammaproteobacteria bacterium]|nr:DUF167 family protein [Gammaproteobacteria bacterium]